MHNRWRENLIHNYTSTMTTSVPEYARRMGLADEREAVTRAEDHFRHLSADRAGLFAALNEGAKAVLCLHLATADEGRFDRALAVKLSGMSRKKYLNAAENLRALLGIREVPTVQEIAVKLNCAAVRADALAALQTYQESLLARLNPRRRADLSFDKALYPCAAVAAACSRAQPKVKYDRAKLLEMSGVAKSELDNVVQAVVQANEAADAAESRKKTPRKRAPDLEERLAAVEEGETAAETPSKRAHARLNEDEREFDYDEYLRWKRKILRLAGLEE